MTALRLHEIEPSSLAIREGDLGDEFRDDQVALVRNATADGSATAYGYDPLEDTEHVRVDGTYYRIRTERGSEEQADGTVLVVAPASDTADVGDSCYPACLVVYNGTLYRAGVRTVAHEFCGH